MLAHEAAALVAIRGTYEEPVVYTGAGLVGATINAIPSNVGGEPFQGAGETVREQSFEIAKALLPQEPATEETIQHGGKTWEVVNVTERDDVDAWVLIVTEAS
jgi:hypothetical protein